MTKSKTSPGPTDSHLWEQVTEHVRPLVGRPLAEAPARPAVRVRARVPEAPSIPASRRIRPDSATLDGGWDRKIRTGRMEIDAVVDLHGYSTAHAHEVLATAIRRSWTHHQRVILVITGKGGRSTQEGRGVIRDSLPGWLEAPDLRGFVAALRGAHPRHGGAGAIYIVLRRQRTSVIPGPSGP